MQNLKMKDVKKAVCKIFQNSMYVHYNLDLLHVIIYLFQCLDKANFYLDYVFVVMFIKI